MPRLPRRDDWLALAALGALVLLVGAAARDPLAGRRRPAAGIRASSAERAPAERDVDDAVARIDRLLAARVAEAGIEPAGPVDELTVLRRAWLGLAGTIPSLEELRRFEADASPDRLERAIDTLLAERRASDWIARRLASALVGDEGGQFIVFRRDRFTDWLADALHAGRPWDDVVRAMVASRGLWTDTPAVNFITQAAADGRLDADKLAGRVARVFLGQRIDCAQCHDHPFAPWKQHAFEGIAAAFAQARLSGVGVEDDPARVHRIEATSVAALASPMAGTGRNVPPSVPFGTEWLGSGGTHRENLAAWVVHPENKRFDRAIVNRAWGILFGRAWHEPVDDIPDPPAEGADLLDGLADDFRTHGRDLRRLFRVLAATRLFRSASTHPLLDSPDGCDRVADAWAAFPITRLGPEQVIGAMVATTSLQTIDRDSHLLTRTIRFFRENDFVREYGSVQDGQGRSQPATIPQVLLQMNGKLAREMVEANAFTATGRIAGMARDDRERLELAFLAALTRRPTTEERVALEPLLAEAPTKGRGVEDVAWVLVNSPEFSWSH